VGSALWLCNHTQLVRIGRREVRVRDLFPWLVAALFLYILGLVASVQAVVDKVTGSLSHTSTVRISKVEAFALVTPFALFLVGAIGLWLLAFAETLDDEKLRRAELDPASR
jgi:hypothetical protein